MPQDTKLPVQFRLTRATGETAQDTPTSAATGFNDVTLPVEIELPLTPELARLLAGGNNEE